MIYSNDINRVCGMCRFYSAENGGVCSKRERETEESREGCKKFSYDILKKPVRRKRKLNTDFSDEDFRL
ncbi:MAG: hypothetical protein LUD03_02050 [Firmicutes bacterium]|nr:hypothetical protein [Bacillota bacterium]